MKEFIDKLISRLEEEKEQSYYEATSKGGRANGKSVAYGENLALQKAISIVNQLAEEYEDCYKDCEQCEAYNKEKYYCPKWCDVIKNTVAEMVENEFAVLLTQLLETKRNCGEDSNCSECPFGQEEDRCYLAELQIKDGNNGWIPCEIELPPQPKNNPLIDNKPLELYMVSANAEYPFRAFWNGRSFTDGFGEVDAIAWQPLPAPYQPKGE